MRSIRFDGGEGTRFLPGEESCKEASRRTGLDTKTNNLRLLLKRCRESFRAIEKPRASQKMNAFIFWSVHRFFAVRKRTAGPAALACPEAGNGTPVSACTCCFYGDKRAFLLLFWLKREAYSLPVHFLSAWDSETVSPVSLSCGGLAAGAAARAAAAARAFSCAFIPNHFPYDQADNACQDHAYDCCCHFMRPLSLSDGRSDTCWDEAAYTPGPPRQPGQRRWLR